MLRDVDIDLLCAVAVTYAIAEVGKGETVGNNRGPDVEKYGGPAGGSWCAAFVSWCFREASLAANIPLPFKTSHGAKALGRNIAAAGRKFTDPSEAKAGDVIVWHRGALPWQGHIGIVTRNEDGALHTLEGNTGAYPSKVRMLIHDVSRERLAFFASMRGK